MSLDLNVIPEGYRHMFYPPVIHIMDEIKDAGKSDVERWSESIKARNEMIHAANLAFFLGDGKDSRSDLEKLLDRFKYAYIKEGEDRYITYVDNKTMKAYRMVNNSYYDGLLYPPEEVGSFTFDRWCRGMDL